MGQYITPIANISDMTTAASSFPQTPSGSRSSTAKKKIIPSLAISNSHGMKTLKSLCASTHHIHVLSQNDLSDKVDVQNYYVNAKGKSRLAIYSLVLNILVKENIRHILCAPLYQEDYLAAIAAKHLLQVPLAVWVLDENIHYPSVLEKGLRPQVPCTLASELFELADIRFILSPEMRDTYEGTFQKKFYVLPSIASPANADIFSHQGLAEWVWESCEKGSPIDDRFERPFRRKCGNLAPYIEEIAPKDVAKHLEPIYFGLRRLAQQGYQADFVMDVGASSGVWSDVVSHIFPFARFILLEPLANRYNDWSHLKHLRFEWVVAAASNKNGNTTLYVSNDLYGSSLLEGIKDHRNYEPVEVPLTTLDAVLIEKEIYGRGILKIDVQHAEHLVLEGARTLLEKVDVLILELTLRPPQEIDTFSFIQMVHHVESLGFHYYDDVGEWRCPITGTLEEKDALFVKSHLISRLSLL